VADQASVQELKLFTENDGDLYRQRIVPILRNLRTKQAQGRYDHDRAVDLFMYLAEAGARKYAREHGGGEHEWHTIFPPDVRRQVSAEWRDEFETESSLGNYDNATFLPKKYLTTAKKPTRVRRTNTPYRSGKTDAETWIRRVDPLPQSLLNIVQMSAAASNYSPTMSLLQEVGPSSAARRLGITTKAFNNRGAAFEEARQEYDRGYLDVCRRTYEASRGN